MTRKRLALVALCIGLTAIAIPAGVQAQKVANPGTFVLQSYQQGAPLSLFSIGTRIPVQYLSQDVSIAGTVAADGAITIPQSQITFPVVPVDLTPYGLTGVVNVALKPTTNATGSINPISGQIAVNVKVLAEVTGNINGVPLVPGCKVGTTTNPINFNLKTEGLGSQPYNPTTGRGVLADNSFAVPGATGCAIPFLFGTLDMNQPLNDVIGLPSPSGINRIVLEGRTLPALAPGIVPVITMSPALNPVTNQATGFSAAASSVSKGPATYNWLFSDGATATGQDVFHTFTTTGSQWARLTITDGDGDVATKQTNFNVNSGSATTSTTTTQPTTTTTSTTTTQPTTTTTSTTTTQPTTTTTSTTTTQPTTTTTQPTTTSTTLPPSSDSVSVRLSGAVTYENAGSGSGNMTVTKDSFGVRTVTGMLEIPGTNGGTSRVDVNVQRAWILPLWTGQVSVRDAGATVSVAAPVFGQVNVDTAPNSAKGTLGWFQLGEFPNLIRPYSLSWSVTDAG